MSKSSCRSDSMIRREVAAINRAMGPFTNRRVSIKKKGRCPQEEGNGQGDNAFLIGLDLQAALFQGDDLETRIKIGPYSNGH